jgi:hypothetical protein
MPHLFFRFSPGLGTRKFIVISFPRRSVNAIKLRIKSGKSLTYNDDVVKRTFIHFDIFVKHFEKRMNDSKKYFSQISRRRMM